MKPKMESNTASVAVIGVDIGKDVFHLVGLGADGKIAFRRKIRRLGLTDVFEKLPPCTPIKATAREPINRPDKYQRLPTAPLICEGQPVHT
jgi:hypothetical protein